MQFILIYKNKKTGEHRRHTLDTPEIKSRELTKKQKDFITRNALFLKRNDEIYTGYNVKEN